MSRNLFLRLLLPPPWLSLGIGLNVVFRDPFSILAEHIKSCTITGCLFDLIGPSVRVVAELGCVYDTYTAHIAFMRCGK
jgi:hypothetical protein